MLLICPHVDVDSLHLGIQHLESLVNKLKVLNQTGVHRLELSMHRLLMSAKYCIFGPLNLHLLGL
jgi:hypothetical protein